MKTLIVMRHAKSSWANSSLDDHQRPLNKRGLRDAPRMAELISQRKLVPDAIFSSTAIRAKTTAELIAENCQGIDCEVQLTEDFYHAPARVYLEMAESLPDRIEKAMFVGHNPGMESLVEYLSGEYEVMPTAAVAIFEFDVESWGDVSDENVSVNLFDVWRPKEVL